MGEVWESELLEARAEALVEHYQKTYELVHGLWEQRNHQFIILVCVLAAAGFLTYVQNVIVAAMPEYLANTLAGLSDEAKKAIKDGFVPAFNLLLAFLVVSVFYLMANLCHRSGTIISLYGYLHALETEIRQELRLPEEAHAFTREGTFYRVTGHRVSRLIGVAYKAVLGLLLLSFFALRVATDAWQPGQGLPAYDVTSLASFARAHFLLLLDIVVGVWTLALFLRYATLRPPNIAKVRRGDV